MPALAFCNDIFNMNLSLKLLVLQTTLHSPVAL